MNLFNIIPNIRVVTKTRNHDWMDWTLEILQII